MRSFSQKFAHAMVLVASIIMVNVALGNPQGGTVTSGSATISNSGNTTTINQSSQQAIVQWNSFNISAQEKTQFIQPNSSAVALNRINAQNGASQIYGRLTSNGRIILINGAGIYFGPSARVDVGGLIASTTDISNANFLAGKYIFDQDTGYHGSITNAGKIIASKYGLVALLGDSVANTGVIQARLGSIVMGSGSIFTLDFNGDQLINFSVDAPASAASTGIHNSGKLLADGGQILVTAKAAAGVLDNVIDMSGVAETRSVSRQGGEIILSGDDNTDVTVSGTLNASGGTQGGTIQVLGGNVHLTSTASLNASGLTGGGNINVGGNEHGEGPLLNATSTTIDAGATLNASALNSGNGGNVIVWSNDYTNYNGSVLAQGGSVSGNGGFSEISGQQVLNFSGTANLSASHGIEGSLLLDPENVTIQATGTSSDPITSGVFTPTVASSILTVANLEAALANENVNVTTGSTGSQAGTIILATSSALTWNSAYSLTLTAASTITLGSAITATNGGLSLVAASTMALNAAITVNTLTLAAGTGSTAKNITPSASAAINVANFDLVEGNWKQNSATLPVFNVTNDFELNSGGGPSSLVSFIRAIGGSGTTGSPYEITDIYGLEGIGSSPTTMGYSYELMNSINATGTATWNGGAGFIPIDAGGFNNSTYFTGTFNGQNFTINGLTINTNNNSQFQSDTYMGLFEQVQNTTIENILLTNLNIYAPNNEAVGGVVGLAVNSNLSDVYVTGSVIGGSYVGGLVAGLGSQSSDTSSISDSYSSATVNGLYAGGLVGIMNNDGLISNSYTTGSITASSIYPQGAGGLIGITSGNGTITDSYSSAVINSNNSSGGGLVGVSQSSGFSINNSFWDTAVSGQSSAVGSGGATLSNVVGGCVGGGSCANGGTVDLSSESTYTAAGWDFTNTWAMGTSYPYLKVFPSVFSGTVSNGTSSASGLTINIYQNGTLLGTSTTNGGGGFSYLPTGLVSGDSLLFTIAGGTVFGNDVTLVPNVSNGVVSVALQLTANTLEIGDLTNANSITNTELGSAITGLSSNTVLYTTPGNVLTIGNSHASVNMATTTLTNLVLGTDSITFGSGTTTGNITFNGAEVLSQDASLANSVGNITLSSTGSIDGAYNLSLGSKANIINGTIGGNTPLASFSLTDATGGGTGADIIGPNSIITSGNQNYSDAVTVSGGPGLSASGGTITFSNTINGTTAGANNLNLYASNINLDGNIGNTVPFSEISFSAASGGNSASITTSGISITAANSININGSMNDSNTDGDSLTLNSAQVNLAGNIGYSSAFNNITISDASGGHSGNLYLTNDNINIDSSNDITINSTIDSDSSGNHYNLTLNSQNTIELNGSIGSMQPLNNLNVVATTLTVGAESITTESNQDYNYSTSGYYSSPLGGTLIFNNATSTTLTTASGQQGNIIFGADVNFNAPSTTVAADGEVVYYGNIEGATALTTGGAAFGNYFSYGLNTTQEIGSSAVPLTSLTFSTGGVDGSNGGPLYSNGDSLEFNNFDNNNVFNIYTVGNQVFNNQFNIEFPATVNLSTTAATANVQLKNGLDVESEDNGYNYNFNITAAGASSQVNGNLSFDTGSSVSINFNGGSTGVLTSAAHSNTFSDSYGDTGPGTTYNINSGTFVLGSSGGLENANLNLPANSIFQLPGDISGGSGAYLNFVSPDQLQVTGNSTADSAVTFNFYSPSGFIVEPGVTFTVNGQINGGTKDGAGTLVLGGTASNLDITTGLVQLVSGGNVNGSTTVESGAALNIDNTTVNGLSVTLNGTGIGGTGALTGTGTAELDSSTISLNSDATIGAPGSSDQFTFDSATSIDGATGAENLILSGLGTIILNGSVGAGGPGSPSLNSFTSSVANLTLGLSSINTAGDQDFSNSIVTVNDANGSGTFTFNTSNGNVNFTDSTLKFAEQNGNSLTVNGFSNGTLNLSASTLSDVDPGQGVMLQGNIVIEAGNSVISNTNSGYATLQLTGNIDADNSQLGNLEFSGNAPIEVDGSIGGNTSLNSLTVDSSAILNIGNPSGYISSSINTVNDQDYNGILYLNSDGTSANLNLSTQSGTINFNSGSNFGANYSFYSNQISISGNANFNNNANFDNSSYITLNSGTSQLNNGNAFGNGTLSILDPAILQMNTDLISATNGLEGDGTIQVLTGNLNINNISQDGGISFEGTYDIAAGASLNIESPLGNYNNATKTSAGELDISSNQNDNTSFDIQAGTLGFLSNANTNSGTITIESGAILALATNGNTLPINIVSNGGTIANSGSNTIDGTLTVTNGTNTISSSNSADYFEVQQAVDSDSSNSGSLTLTGPGTVQFDASIGGNYALASFTASNTGGVNFGGNVATIGNQDYQSTVNFNNTSTLASTTGAVTFESNSSINTSTDLSFLGNVILNNTSSNFNGANVYFGDGTTPTSITFNNSGALAGISNIYLDTNATLALNADFTGGYYTFYNSGIIQTSGTHIFAGDGLLGGGTIQVDGSGSLDVQDETMGTFVKNGTGKLTLDMYYGGGNTNTVNAGTLSLDGGSFGGSTILVNSGGTLNFNNTTASNLTIDLNGTGVGGNGALTATGASELDSTSINLQSSASIETPTNADSFIFDANTSITAAASSNAGLTVNAPQGGFALPYVDLTDGGNGNLVVNANGAITENDVLVVSGSSTFNAGANAITLNNTNQSNINGNYTGNQLSGAINVSNSGANDILIVNNAATTTLGTISAGQNVEFDTQTGSGNAITVGSANVLTSTNTLTLNASDGSINLNANITGSGNLVLTAQDAPQSIMNNGAAIEVNNFTLNVGNYYQNSGGAALAPFTVAGTFHIAAGSEYNSQYNATFTRVLGGDGSSGNPYQIGDIYGLQGVGTLPTSNNYILANNIDASATATYNGGAGFNPLFGNSNNLFTGTFDGGNFVISNLFENTAGDAGLFDWVSSGVIQNVGLAAVNISGKDVVGGLAANLYGGTLTNDYVSSGSVTNTGQDTGGLVGENYNGSIATSHNSATVTGGNVGGVVGVDYGNITQSYNTGNVFGSFTGPGAEVGGVVGYVGGGDIDQNFNTGNVSLIAGGGSDYVGGFVGYMFFSGDITNSYSIGNVSTNNSSDYIGGFAGGIYSAFVSTSYSASTITAPAGTATTGSLGGFLGYAYNGAAYLTNDFYDSTVAPGLIPTGSGTPNNGNDATGLSTADIKNFQNLSGFDFTSGLPIWAFTQNTSTNGGYAVLTALTPGPYQSTSVSRTISGQVTGGDQDYSITFTLGGVSIGTATTNSSGNYTFTTTSATNNADLFAYITTSGYLANAITLAPSSNGNITGLNFSANTITLGDSNVNTFSNSDFATAIGSLTSPITLFSMSGNTITLNAGINLASTASTTLNLNGDITGTGNITLAGQTNLVTNANITSSAGSVALNNVAGAQNLTVSSTTGTSISGTVNVNSIAVDNGGTISGKVTGSTSVTASGGTLDITNSTNDYTGGTAVSSGAVATDTASGFGAGSVSVADGGAADLSGQVTVANSFSLSGTGSIYDVDSSGTDTVSGAVSLANGSTSNLNAASGSTLKFTNTVSGTGALDLQGSGTVSLQGAVNVNSVTSTADNVALGASVTTAGGQSYAGTTSLGANVTLADTASGGLALGAVTGNGHALTLNTAGSSSLGSYSDGSGASNLIQAGSGTLTLSSASSYTGGTLINSGAVSVANNTALGAGSVAVATGTALDVNGGITIINAINLTGTGAINDSSSSGIDMLKGAVALGSASTISAASGSTLEFLNGSISGASALTLSGLGTINLQEAVTGLTSLSSTVANLTLGAGITSTGAQTYSNAVTVGGTETLTTTNNAITFNGTLNGAGALTLASGAAQNILSGVVGGTTPLINLSSTGSGGISIGSNVTTDGSQSYTGTTVLASSVTLKDTSASGGVTLAAVTGNGNGLIINTNGSSAITGIFADGSGASSLTQAGNGTLTLSGANSYTGGTTVNDGSLDFSTNTGLGSGAVLIQSGGLLGASGDLTNIMNAITLTGTASLYALDTSGTDIFKGAITLTAGGAPVIGANTGSTIEFTNTINGAADLLLSGPGAVNFQGVVGGSGALNSISESAVAGLTLGANVTTNGSQSYSGSTAVELSSGVTLTSNNSSIAFGSSTSLNSSSTTLENLIINTSSGATLAGTIGNLNNLSSLTFSGGGTLSSVVSGATTLTLNSGTLIVSGLETYTGVTNVSGGTLQVGATNATSGASAITISSGAALNLNGFSTLIGSLSGAGSIANIASGQTLTSAQGTTSSTYSGTLSGAGTFQLGNTAADTATLTLSGNNSSLADIVIQHGILQVSANNSLANTLTTIASGAELTLNTSTNTTFSNAILANGTGVSVAGAIVDTSTSSSTNTLSNVSFGVSSGLGVSSSTETLVLSDALSGAVGLLKTGAGTVELTAANTYSGSTSIFAGTLALGVNNAISYNSSVSVSTNTLNMNGYSDAIGSLTGSGSVITGGGVLTISQGASTDTFSGIISGSGGITVGSKAGDTGLLKLTGLNTYTGATTIALGSLEVGIANAIGSSSAVNISSGATLNMNSLSDTIGGLTGAGSVTNLVSGQALTVAMGANTDNFSGTLAGTGSLKVGNTTADTGILELSGSNTGFNGTATVQFGEVELTNASSLGTGTATINAGAELALSTTANTTFANAITVNGTGISNAGGLTDISNGMTNALSDVILGTSASVGVTNSNETLNITNAMNGSNSLTKVGAGILGLSGANSYSGGTSVSSGILSITNSSGLGTGAASIASGAALDVSNNITLTNALTLSGSGIGGTGVINDIGTGTTDTISSAIALSGASTIGSDNSGTLKFSNTITGAQALTLVGAGMINLAGAVGGGGGANVLSSLSATVNSLIIGANITTTGTQSYGAVTMGGTETLSSTNSAINFGSITGGGNALTVAAGTAQAAFGGVVSGVTNLSSTGSGGVLIGANITTAGSQSYSGTTVLGAAVTLQDSASGGITLGAVTGNGHALTVNTGGNSALGSYSDGSGASSLIQAGGGTLTLSSASGYTGGTQVNSGVVSVSNNSSLGTGSVAVATGAALDVNGGIILGNAINLTGTGAINDTSSSGTDTLQGAVSLGNASTINAASGSTLEFLNSSISGASALTLAGAGTINLQEAVSGLTSLSATVSHLTIGAGITTSGTQTYSNAVTIGGTETLATTNNAITFNGTLNGAGALTLASGTAQDVLSGIVGGSTPLTVLSSTGSGGISIGANVTTAGSQSYAGTTVLGASVTLKDTSASGSVTLAAVTGNGHALTMNTLGTSFITGNFTGTGSSLTQAGTGTLVLGGMNTYSGGTAVTNGEVEVTNGSALGAGAAVVSSGAELAIDTSSAANFTNSITINGSGIGASGALVDISAGGITNTLNNMVLGSNSLIGVSNSGNTLNVSGTISGTGFGIDKVGAGNLELSGANTYSGTTEINQGTLTLNNANAISSSTLQVDANGSLGLAMNTALNGLTGMGSVDVVSGVTLTVNNTTTNTYNGALSGSGSLVITGSGTLALATASNSFTGSVSVTSGTLQLNVNNALMDSSGIALTSGGTLNLNGTSQLIGPLSGTGGTVSGLSSGQTLTVASGSGSSSYAGTISGTGNLVVGNSSADTGTIILSGNNSGYSGTTTAAFGELEISNSNALGAGSANITGGTLAINAINVANTINLNGGTLTGLGTSSVSGAVNVNSNSQVSTTGNFTVNGTVSGAGTLDLEGSGTVSFSNNITSLGGLTSNAATTKVQSVATTGNQTYNGVVVISNNVALTSNSGNIAVNAGISGASKNVSITTGTNNNSVTLAGSLAVNNISVTGGGSNNTLNLQTGNVQTFNITGANVGNVSGISEQGGTFTFTNIQNLGGSANGDTFQLLGGSIGNIVGGSGNNTIIANNVANTFMISGMNSGSLTSVASFSSIQNLVGGTATNDFVFANNGGISGTINGTSSAGNVVDYSAYTTPMSLALTANNSGFALNQGGAYITGNFTNIQTIAGNGMSALNITNSKSNTVTFTGSIAATVDDPTNVAGFDGVYNAGTGTTEVDFGPGENAVFLSPNSASINGGPTIYFGPGITFGGNITAYVPPPTPPSSASTPSTTSTSTSSSDGSTPNVANIITSPTTNNSNSTNTPANDAATQSATSVVIDIIQNNLSQLISDQQNDDETTQVSQPIFPNCAS